MAGDTFGFKEEPFGIEPHERFFYGDSARERVCAHLSSSIRESKGLVLLTGGRGVGKTILLHHLVGKLEAVHGVALLPPSRVLSCETSPSLGEIVRACRLQSNASYDAAGDEDDESGLVRFLERRGKADPPVALVLDGADHLSLEVLKRLKALSALTADQRGRLSIVLSGCLDAPNGLSCSAFENAELGADVSLRLQRFQDRDVKPYICHRIQLAGRKGPALFAPSAIDRIIHYSRGNPLSINRICRSTLVIASRQTLRTVSAEMVDEVAAAGAGGTATESLRDSGKASVRTSDFERPSLPNEHETDVPDHRSRPVVLVSQNTTVASEKVEEKSLFREDTVDDPIGKAEIAASARISSTHTLEELKDEERGGRWYQDRIAVAVRCLWFFLAATLAVGVTGVYLAQTGRFDAIEFSKRWLAQLSGEESTIAQNDPRGLGLVEGRPSHWVEPSSKLDREYPSETVSTSSSGEARQPPDEKRQSTAHLLQDGESPVKSGSEARLDEAFNRTSVSPAPGSISSLDGAIEKAGPDRESKPVTESNEPIDRPQLAITTNSRVESDETVETTGSLDKSESSTALVEPGDGGESRSATESTEGDESLALPFAAGSAVDADEPLANQVAPAGMETVAGSEEVVASPEVAVEASSVAEADEPVEVQVAPAGMETAAGGEKVVASPEVAAEGNSAAEADEPVASQAVPAGMETLAGSEEVVASPEVAAEVGSALDADEPVEVHVAPAGMETVAGSGEAVASPEVAAEEGSAAEADEPVEVQVAPAGMETVAGSEGVMASPEVAVEAGSTLEADEPVEVQVAPAVMETVAGSGEAVARPEVAAEEGSAAEADEPVEVQAVPAGMETAAGSEEVVESPEVVAEAGSVAEADEPTAQLVRPAAEAPESEVNVDYASNLRSGSKANGAQEVTVPVPAGVNFPEFRGAPKGRPEPRFPPSKSEVPALGKQPTPFQVAESTQSQLDLDPLISRGDQLLALGDVASARLFYRLAATKGSARGATAMGSTYDPVYLERIAVVGARPSPAEAIKWYRQAMDMGHRGAEVQLRELTNRLERAAALGDGEAQRILEGVRN